MKTQMIMNKIKTAVDEIRQAIKDNETAEALLQKLETHVKSDQLVTATFSFGTSGKDASIYLGISKGVLRRILEEEVARSENLLLAFESNLDRVRQWLPENAGEAENEKE